jgi:hypothetical protein
MPIHLRTLTGLIAVFSFLATSADACALEPLQAGIAVVDITPFPGCRMSGYFNERINTGTLDPLLAKAVVFRQGNVSAALVFCDLIGLSREVSHRSREIAERETGIPAGNISITATHSHTGPLYFGALREHFHNKAIAEKRRDRAEIIDYSMELTGRLVRAIEEAQKNLAPVELSAGYAREERLAFNRRFHMNNGAVVFNPGQLNPNIVRAAGPIDPEVGIVKLKAPGATQPLGAIISFAMHLDTVGGTQYSADYPRFVQDTLRESQGTQFVSLFGTGTCGDINHVDVTKKDRRPTREIGTMLAKTVEPQLSQLKPVEKPSLGVATMKVYADLQEFSPDEVATARRNMDLIDDPKVSFLDQVKACKIVSLQAYLDKKVGLQNPEFADKEIVLEVQAFRLGSDCAIVTLPGEVFVELGMAIKQASPFRTTLVIELANDTPHYIPTKKAFAEGSYETVNSIVAPGTGEQLVQAAEDLLKELSHQ